MGPLSYVTKSCARREHSDRFERTSCSFTFALAGVKWQAALQREGVEPRTDQVQVVADWLRGSNETRTIDELDGLLPGILDMALKGAR